MASFRVVLMSIAIVSSLVPTASGQQATQLDSSADVPNLVGRWRVSTPMSPAWYVTLRQSGSALEGDLIAHFRCRGEDVTAHLTFLGQVTGHTVVLQASPTEFEGDFFNRCREVEFRRAHWWWPKAAVVFEGELSLDGKNIKGPWDHSGLPEHVWMFQR